VERQKREKSEYKLQQFKLRKHELLLEIIKSLRENPGKYRMFDKSIKMAA